MYKKIIAIILGSMLLSFCSEDEPFIPRFSVDITADSFPAEGGSKTITLTSNISWSASSNVDWLSVSPTSGKEGTTLTLTASENNTPTGRKATVTLTPQTGDAIIINVSQPSDHQFSVDVSEVTLEPGPGEFTVNITASTTWQASSNADWLTVSPGSGSGNEKLILTTSQNEVSEERSALLTLTPDVGDPIEIPVTQKGILFSTDVTELTFGENPGYQTVTLTTDMSWEVTFDADWLTIDPPGDVEGGEITFTVPRNRSNDQRTAIVLLTPEVGESITLQVSQQPSGYSSEMIKFVAVHAVGSGNGASVENAADFRDGAFWDEVNNDLQSQSVEVIFLPGDYARAYIAAGSKGNGLAFNRMGDENNRLTLTGGEEVIFTVPEGYAKRNTLVHFHGSQNITFRDFHFTGNGDINYVLAIRTPSEFPPSRNILIESCSWSDMHGVIFGATGCHYEGTTEVTYKNCSFKRIGVGTGSHMMYHAYGPTRIHITECHFEDCMGEYVRFRDRADFGRVNNCTFVRTKDYAALSFLNIAVYNDVDPGDEFFGTNFSFIDNHFENKGYDNIGAAIFFRHRGYSPPGYRYLPTPEEGVKLTTGSKRERMKQFKINFGIDFEKIRVVNNNYSQNISNEVTLYTYTAYGSVSLGWRGTIYLNDLVSRNNTPFQWEESWLKSNSLIR